MKKITRNKIKNKEEFFRSEYWIPVIRSNWESYASLVCLKTIYQNTVTNQFRAHQWHSIWIFGDLFQINIDSIESKMMYFMKIASNEKRRTFISILPKLIQTYSISNWHEYFWFFIFRYDMWVMFMNIFIFFSLLIRFVLREITRFEVKCIFCDCFFFVEYKINGPLVHCSNSVHI